MGTALSAKPATIPQASTATLRGARHANAAAQPVMARWLATISVLRRLDSDDCCASTWASSATNGTAMTSGCGARRPIGPPHPRCTTRRTTRPTTTAISSSGNGALPSGLRPWWSPGVDHGPEPPQAQQLRLVDDAFGGVAQRLAGRHRLPGERGGDDRRSEGRAAPRRPPVELAEV